MSEQYEPNRREDDAAQSAGFFRLDRLSTTMLVVTVLALGATYGPFLLGAEWTLLGYPWLLLSQPIVMVVLGGLFVTATYYGERRQEVRS
ncbi:hypothetical protein [Natrinema longum]|uniref:hypothetical protein n=1 Tax=Natrinema longum TaxID=370324 RepID=UPI001CCC677F|nr:hypothetical protein [Natrinema longum]MBZ6496810.1 hypothetical protein [Natrinema longum]